MTEGLHSLQNHTIHHDITAPETAPSYFALYYYSIASVTSEYFANDSALVTKGLTICKVGALFYGYGIG